MINFEADHFNNGGRGVDIYPLNEVMGDITDPEAVEKYTDEEIAEALVLFNEAAQKLLLEAQRRGILEQIMKQAMELQGAPKKG